MTIFANIISLYRSQDLSSTPAQKINLTLIDGSKYKFTSKKPILVHFWATWCPVCKTEASNIESIAKENEVLSIAVRSGSDITLQQYMKEKGLSYPVYNDKDGVLASQYKISVYPTTFIYNNKGELIFSEVGYTSTFGLWLRMWWASL